MIEYLRWVLSQLYTRPNSAVAVQARCTTLLIHLGHKRLTPVPSGMTSSHRDTTHNGLEVAENLRDQACYASVGCIRWRGREIVGVGARQPT